MQLTLYGSIAWRHPFGFGQAIDWAEQFGWQAVDARGLSLRVPGDLEKRTNAFGYDMLCPRQIRGSARDDLRRRLESAGVIFSGIYCSSSINLPGQSGDVYRDYFREYLQLAADAGAEWIRPINNTTSTLDGGEMSREEAYDLTVAGLKDVGQRAADLDVGLLLENNENTIPDDAQSLDQLRSDISGICKVGIVYDPVNAYFMGDNPVAGLDALAGTIDIIHLKNVRRHSSQRWDFMPRGDHSYEWISLADGDLDWPQLLRQAYEGGFRGPLVYEYVNPFKGMPPQYWDTLPEPEEAAEREGRYLQELVSALE